MKGGPGADELHGGGGDDRLITRDGIADTVIDGGPGNDSAKIDDGSDTPQNVETLLP